MGVLLPALVGAEQGEVKDRGAVARAYGVVAVLLLFVVAPVAWRDRWRERKAVASLSSGSDRGLPVALFMSAQRKVTLYVRGEREPFAAFNARDAPNDEPPAVPLDSQIPGTLFGDLRSRGWAAVATGGVLILPETP